MKHIMKTAMALVLALAVLLIPMTVSAALGDYSEPYELTAGGTRLSVYVQPETSVYVKASDSNGSVVNVGYATASTYFLQYGRLTTVYPNNDADNTATLTLDPAMNIFEVYNSGSEAITVYMTLTAGTPVDKTGTMESPVELTLSASQTASAKKELAAGNDGYWYTITAPDEGYLHVTIGSVDANGTSLGWLYFVNNNTQAKYGDSHWSDDDPAVNTESVAVKAGDEVDIFVATYDPASMFSNPAGTVSVTVTFEAAEVDNDDNDNNNGGDSGDDEINYVISDSELEVGTDEYAVDTTYPYTVYAFAPTETGKYTISCADGAIGIVSYTDMWVQNTPSEDNVNADAVVWECTAVGQGIYVAVMSGADTVSVTVEREELVVKEEVPWVIYENVVTPETFVLDGNFDDMMYVETFDDIVDEAVLGEDGFYHLNDAYGPILYACLSDSLMNLADAWGFGQLKEVIVDGEGNVVSKTDFYYAFEEYYLCADTETGLYPLTVDLIEMFTRIGAYHNWYGETGFIGGDFEDAWMFACYYNEGETFEPGATTTTAAETTTTKTDSPKTADASDAMNMLLAAVLAAGAIVMTVVSKKAKA